jgi:hypothetical protein
MFVSAKLFVTRTIDRNLFHHACAHNCLHTRAWGAMIGRVKRNRRFVLVVGCYCLQWTTCVECAPRVL